MADPRRSITISTFHNSSQKSDSAFIPVLLDIKHNGIVWNYPESEDPEVLKLRQQDGHIRFISDVRGVIYKGDDDKPYYYAPCNFSVKLPKEDGKTKSTASISISCIDNRIIEIIRSIEEDLTCQVIAMYAKIKNEDDKVKYAFSKLYGKEFTMGQVSWDGITANWTLDPDLISDLSTPRKMGSQFNLPSISGA